MAKVTIQDSIPTDSVNAITADTAAVRDSIPALVMTAPQKTVKQSEEVAGNSFSDSYVLGGVLILFLLFCLQFRRNFRFISTLWDNLTDMRIRGRKGDRTVRETSFMIILNIICAFSLGGLLFLLTTATTGSETVFKGTAFHLPLLRCVIITGIYCFVMPIIYRLCGWTFANTKISELWANTFMSTQALTGMILFPLIVAGCFYPTSPWPIIVPSLVIYGLGKLIFIYKGLMFFWKDFASHLVFLYYLCTLEIVPLITMYLLSLIII